MYASGIPLGWIVDHKGPRWATSIGAIGLACGYFLLYTAFDKGPGAVPMAVLCFASFLSGMGSCSAFAGAMKVCTTNWPQHRGTATAFPLGAFGLSAFGYTMISSFAFKSDTGKFLLFLAVGTFFMVFIGSLFLRILPVASGYQSLPSDESRRPAFARQDSTKLNRTDSRHSRHNSRASVQEPSMYISFQASQNGFQCTITDDPGIAETSSLLSGPGDISSDDDKYATNTSSRSQKADITGMALLHNTTFWKQFIMLGLLCGVGLMTIK